MVPLGYNLSCKHRFRCAAGQYRFEQLPQRTCQVAVLHEEVEQARREQPVRAQRASQRVEPQEQQLQSCTQRQGSGRCAATCELQPGRATGHGCGCGGRAELMAAAAGVAPAGSSHPGGMGPNI